MVTLAKKIIAHASGKEQLATGDIVMASVDLAMVHDSSGPRRLVPKLQELGMSPWDSNKIVVVSDHFVPADTESAQMIQKITKSWVRDHDISHYYDSEGICHVLLPERGHIKPGMFCVGGDSHSPTAGAFGAYMFGVGATDMAGVMATGETWLTVPETILIEWQGVLQPNVCAKDMILKLCADFGIAGAADHVVQFTGSTISSLGMQERMTLTNMTAELGAQTGIIAPDEVTYNYLHPLVLIYPYLSNIGRSRHVNKKKTIIVIMLQHYPHRSHYPTRPPMLLISAHVRTQKLPWLILAHAQVPNSQILKQLHKYCAAKRLPKA